MQFNLEDPKRSAIREMASGAEEYQAGRNAYITAPIVLRTRIVADTERFIAILMSYTLASNAMEKIRERERRCVNLLLM